jgi:hypothetical protein
VPPSATPTKAPSPTATAVPTAPASVLQRPATAAAAPQASPTPEPPPPLVLRQEPPMTLKDWPRPAQDNGIGIHFSPDQYASDKDVDYGISLINDMGMKWALVIYSDENYLASTARKFKAAGITVVWRKMLRAYEPYYDWERDINILKSIGMPPYMQIYNEPSVGEEWSGHPMDRALFLENFVQASRDIYNAGGYVGFQFIKIDWLVDGINAIKARQGDAIFSRMFFVPHPYGLNHPPDYTQDMNGVLGFLAFADVFQKQIGFVPPMIAGEGGWKYHADDDRRYPQIDDTLHRDYHEAIWNWFRSGKLSNGQDLPDYLFAFCPWLLFGGDASAWYNSFQGTRQMTIDMTKSMSHFVRKFSWER